MRFLTSARVMLAIVAMLGLFVMLGFFSVTKTLGAIEQPKLTLQREGFGTRMIPMAVTTLTPGMVVRQADIGNGPWPVREISGDIILSARLIVGRVVQQEIKSATPIDAASSRDWITTRKTTLTLPDRVVADAEYCKGLFECPYFMTCWQWSPL